MSKRNFVTVALAALVILLSSGAADAQLAYFEPDPLVISTIGGNADLNARVSGIADLWGVDFWVTYDQTIVNLTAPIGVGVCPAPDLPLANTVDNGTGVGHYAVSAFATGPCDCAATPDQLAAVFNFQRMASGISPIDFSLVSPPGVSVLANNSVEVCNAGTPDCWQGPGETGVNTDVPVELTSITID